MEDGQLDINDLPRWAEENDDDDEFNDDDDFDIVGGTSDGKTFPVNAEVNEKVVVWQGNITQLRVDAIVNNTNETLSDRTEVSGLIHDIAGPALEQECRKIGSCRPGEARLTTSGKIKDRGGASWVIHTVAPEWKDDSAGNPEAVLESCYQNVIEQAKRKKLQTIAFCVLKRKDYPREHAAHICCRTLRRVLESSSWISRIALVFRQSDVYDQMIYEIVLPLYFPRNQQELVASKEHLPKYQEVWASEKQLLDEEKASLEAVNKASQEKVGGTAGGRRVSNALEPYDSAPPTPTGVTASLSSLTGFDPKSAINHEESLGELVRQAHADDLEDIRALEMMFVAGKDPQGRPIVMFIEAHLPNKKQLLDRVLMYIIKTLDSVADNDYVLVYVSRLKSPEYIPELAWFRKAYDLFDRRFKKNVKQVFVVHPSFWVKASLAMFRPLISSKMYDKIIYVEKLPDMYQYHPRGSFYLPDTPSIRLYLEGEELPAVQSKGVAGLQGAEAIGVMTSDLSNAQKEIEDIKKKLEMAIAAKEQLSKELVHMAGQLAESEKKREEQITKLKTDRESLLKERDMLSAKVEEGHSNKDEVTQAQSVVTHLEDQLHQAQQDRDMLAGELADIAEQLEQALVYNNLISGELVKEAEEIQRGKIALVARMAQLEIAVETADAHVSMLKKELAEVEERNITMKKEFFSRFRELEGGISDVKQEADEAVEAARQAQEEVVTRVRTQLRDAAERERQLNAEIDALRADKEKLLDVIHQLQNKLRSAAEEAQNKDIGVNLDDVERMIAEAEQGVETIERKLAEETGVVDPKTDEAKNEMRGEVGELMEKMVGASEEEKAKYVERIKELEALMQAMSKSSERDKSVMDIDPRQFELEQGIVLLRMQQKVFQMVKIMQLAASSPLQKAFLKWQSFVVVDEADKRGDKLRRAQTLLNSQLREAEDRADNLEAEVMALRTDQQRMRKQLEQSATAHSKLEEEMANLRTQHHREMEEALEHMEEEKERLVADNADLLAKLAELRQQLQDSKQHDSQSQPGSARSVQAAA